MIPPLVVVFVFTPIYLRYLGNPTDSNFILLVIATGILASVGVGLGIRLRRILRREPALQERERPSLRAVLKFGLALVGFLAIYLSAIYAVVFGLQPLDESSEAGAIATTLILLAVMIGLPIGFYFGLRALGFKDRWPS